jgi:hypothetical protein
VAEPRGDFYSGSSLRFLNSRMEIGCNVEVEVTHRALRVALVEGSYLLTTQAPLHDVTQYRSARLVEACG